ncbi:MAG: hypothetical protein MJ252_05130 [archaeon]|nr:hypothetical protein [archaeon]
MEEDDLLALVRAQAEANGEDLGLPYTHEDEVPHGAVIEQQLYEAAPPLTPQDTQDSGSERKARKKYKIFSQEVKEQCLKEVSNSFIIFSKAQWGRRIKTQNCFQKVWSTY